MTQETRQLVLDYCKAPAISKLPQIIIATQADDDVANTVDFWNSYRLLRNLAAHEPDTIVSQINSVDNNGCVTRVFKSKSIDAGKSVVFTIDNFTACMFNMYLVTHEVAYLAMWKTTIHLLYSDSIKRRDVKREKFHFSEAYHGTMIRLLISFNEYLWRTYRKPKAINMEDNYVTCIYDSNKKLFWKLAIPEIMDVIFMFADDTIDIRDEKNIRTFIKLYKEREGC